MNDFARYLRADGEPREASMPDRSTAAWRRPEAASEQTAQIDVAAVIAKLDEMDRKVSGKHRSPKPKRPLSWQAAVTIVLVVLGILATIVLLAALHVLPAAV